MKITTLHTTYLRYKLYEIFILPVLLPLLAVRTGIDTTAHMDMVILVWKTLGRFITPNLGKSTVIVLNLWK